MAAARSNRRRRRNRGLFGPLFKVLCALAVLAALTFGVTVFFQVETVVVSGNVRYTQEEIVAASGIQIGDNLFRMNKYEIDRNIRQQLPYINEANINRSPPSTIVIMVSEWNAVARVEKPEPEDSVPAGPSSSGDSSEQEPAPEIAREAWLISPPSEAGCKLLEPVADGASDGSAAISVTGIAPIMPRAGTMLAVSQAEQPKLDALEGLLAVLGEREKLAEVSSIRLGSTQLTLRWDGRFDVIIPLNADFDYKLRFLEKAIEQVEAQQGRLESGSFDMTADDDSVLFDPG